MSSPREMRLRIRSVKNIAQVTKALETVSASNMRKAVIAENATRPYAEKAWKVLLHLARQPGHETLHPLLKGTATVNRVLVLMISSDRGLAGPFNMNIVRFTLESFRNAPYQVRFVTIGRKGRDMLVRRHQEILAEFSNLPVTPRFTDVSAIGRLAVDEFLSGGADRVMLAYTDYVNTLKQVPTIKTILPVPMGETELVNEYGVTQEKAKTSRVFTYEPDQNEILDQIISRFTAVQIYQAILSSQTSEFSARMVAMRNATDNADELTALLQLDYNKARQQTITNDMIDITGGVNALMQEK